MSDNQQDALKRVYAQLVALKQNLPNDPQIEECYVAEYQALLTQLQELGIDVEEFHIPKEMVRQIRRPTNYLTGEVRYSKTFYLKRPFFLMKVDALLQYFEITYDERKPRIGFAAVHSSEV